MQTLSLPPPSIPVLDLLHAHGDSTKSLQLSSLVPFAIRTYFVSSFVSSVRKSAPLTEDNLTGDGKSIIVRSSVKDYLQFTIHTSLPFDANIILAPSLNPSPQGGGKCWKTLTIYPKAAL